MKFNKKIKYNPIKSINILSLMLYKIIFGEIIFMY